MHQKNPIAFKSTDYDLYTSSAELGDSAPTDCVCIKRKPKKSRRGRKRMKMRMITRTNASGGGLKKMNPCPRVINQRTKVGGEETRIIQFHGWNINNGVRGPWIISGRRGISRTSISTPFANNLTSVPPRLNISETAAVVGSSVRVYCTYTHKRINFPYSRTSQKFRNVNSYLFLLICAPYVTELYWTITLFRIDFFVTHTS